MIQRLLVYVQLNKDTKKLMVLCPACHAEFDNCCNEPFHCFKCGEVVTEEWSEVE